MAKLNLKIVVSKAIFGKRALGFLESCGIEPDDATGKHQRQLRLRRRRGEDRRLPRAGAFGRLGRGDTEGATSPSIAALPPPPSPSHLGKHRSKKQAAPLRQPNLPGIEPARD